MGLFRQEFGYDTDLPANQGNWQDRFAELQQKYAPALQFVESNDQFLIKKFYVYEERLNIKGAVRSQKLKDELWRLIEQIDPQHPDIVVDLAVDPDPQTDPSVREPAPGGERYTVQAGDTLSEISRRFYNDQSKYTRIIDANRDQINKPDQLRPGQVLTIPPA